jgi:hypothetical protein
VSSAEPIVFRGAVTRKPDQTCRCGGVAVAAALVVVSLLALGLQFAADPTKRAAKDARSSIAVL